MAHLVTSADIPVDGETLKVDKVQRIRSLCGMVAVGGYALSFLVMVFGLFVSDKAQGAYIFSWLWAFFFFTTLLALGGCFWTLLHNPLELGVGDLRAARDGEPGIRVPLHDPLRASVPLSLRPEVPLRVDGRAPRRHPRAEREGAPPPHRPPPLRQALVPQHSVLVRAVLRLLRVARFHHLPTPQVVSIAQDTDPNPGTARLFRSRRASAWGIPCFAVVLTFLSIDLVQGLDYKWFSTMWGVYVFAGSALNAMAVIILVTILLRRAGYLKNVVGPEHDHLMGKLVFAFTIFWAYISFSQFFLYWYANITEETRYFILRNTGMWNSVSILLVFGHFAAPFLLLIRQDLKRRNSYMIGVACYLLFMHMIDVYHMIIPERGPSVSMAVGEAAQFKIDHAFFGDAIAFVFVGAGFLFFLLKNIGSAALYPHRDPRILESANVHN